MDIESKLQITEPLGAGEVAELVGLFKKHPYWHLPMAVLARHFRLQGSEKLDIASAMAALRIPSQSELFNYVYSEIDVPTDRGIDIEQTKDLAPTESPETPLNEPKDDVESIDTLEDANEAEVPDNNETLETDKVEPNEDVETNDILEETKDVPDESIELSETEVPLNNESIELNELDTKPEELTIDMVEPAEDVTEVPEEEIPSDIEDPTYQEIQPFVANMPEMEEKTIKEEVSEIKIEKKTEVTEEEDISETEEPKTEDQSVERTLEEIERLMQDKSGFSIIPEKTESKPLNESMQTSDELLSSYSITDHFTLPASEKVSDSKDFYYWLTQGKVKNTPMTKPTSKIEKEVKPRKKKLNKSEILDEFIKRNPSISPIKPNETKDLTDYSKKADKMPLELATETLARIYVQQGNISAAKKIYKLLILKFPSKKPYFASQIDELKNKK